MIVDSLVQIAKDTTQKANEYLTRGEMLDIFEKAQGGYNGHINIFLILVSIALVVFGFGIPLFQYFINRKSEKAINNAINGIDAKIDTKVIEKIQTEFDKKIEEKTGELEQTIEELKDKVKNEDENLQIRIDLPIKMIEGYSRLNDYNHLEAFQILIEALHYSFKLKNDYYVETVNNRINDIISDYKVNGNALNNTVTGDDIGRAHSRTIIKEEDTTIRNQMDRYINSYRREIEEINNERQKNEKK